MFAEVKKENKCKFTPEFMDWTGFGVTFNCFTSYVLFDFIDRESNFNDSR